MATEETPTPVAETVADDQPAADAVGEENPGPAGGKQAKAKAKAKVPKEPKPKKPAAPRKPRAPSTHPPYIEMISEAVATLKEKTGSSQYAITKFIEDKQKGHLPPNFRKLLLFQLKKLTAAGKLTKVKNSYKLSAVHPKPAASVAAGGAPKATPKPKPKPKPKASAAAKPRPAAKAKAPKPKAKPAAAAKPKAAAKSKAAVTKPKAALKTKAAAKPKPKGRPAKAAKVSVKDSPGKRAAPAKKAAAPAKKAAAAAKKPKSVRSTTKSPAKKRTRASK